MNGPRGSNAYRGVQPEVGLGYGGILDDGGIMDVSEVTYADNLADESSELHDYRTPNGGND